MKASFISYYSSDIGSRQDLDMFLNLCLNTPKEYNILKNSHSVVSSGGEVQVPGV